ncbi:MAG: HEAT repeat domain-containing protein [Candidatus Hodarchaeota archaeon]
MKHLQTVTRLNNEETAEKLSQIADFLEQYKGDRKRDQPIPLTLLLDLMEDANPRVRWQAIEALGVLGKSEQSVDALIAALQDPNHIVRWNAALALGEAGDERVTLPLLEILEDESKDVREMAEWALVELSGKIVPSLIEILTQHPDWWIRREAARILGLIGDERATEPLLQALSDRSERIRENVAEALGRIGRPRAIKGLIHALQDDYGQTRQNAMEALIKIGTDAVETLIKALKSRNKIIRMNVCQVLGAIGDQRAIKPLTQLRHDSDFKVRRGASKALKRIRQKIN